MKIELYKYLLSYKNENNFGKTGFQIAGESDFTSAGVSSIFGICLDDSGNIFLSDPINHAIYKVTKDGEIALYAGQPGVRGNNGATRVTLGNAKFASPGGIFMDRGGNLFVADVENNQIRVIDTNGYVSLYAGSSSGESGFVDGDAITTARFNRPQDITTDQSGNVYVADTQNNSIRIIRGDGKVYTLAGNGTVGDATGQGSTARFNKPYSIASRSNGDILIADTNNHKFKILNRQGVVYHFSGSGAFGDFLGDALTSTYHILRYSDVEQSGNLYIIDYDNLGYTSRVLKIRQDGVPQVAVDFENAKDKYPVAVALDQSENMYVVISDIIENTFGDGDTITLQDENYRHVMRYTGGADTNGEVIVNGVSFNVGDVAGSFVWDIGGAGEHTFAVVDETIERTAAGVDFYVVWRGSGSQYFTIDVRGEMSSSSSESSSTQVMSSSSSSASSSSSQTLSTSSSISSASTSSESSLIYSSRSSSQTESTSSSSSSSESDVPSSSSLSSESSSSSLGGVGFMEISLDFEVQ